MTDLESLPTHEELMQFQIFRKIFILRNMVEYHSRKYYNEDAPELSDADFDRLYSKLEQLENDNPWYITSDSPTQRVGGTASTGFKKIKHLTPMRSLAKVHTWEEFCEWDEKLKKLLTQAQ